MPRETHETAFFRRHTSAAKKAHYAPETKLKVIDVGCISVGKFRAAPFPQTKAGNCFSTGGASRNWKAGKCFKMTSNGARFICAELVVEVGTVFVQFSVRHKLTASLSCGLADLAFLQHFIGHESFFIPLSAASGVPENTLPHRTSIKIKDLSRFNTVLIYLSRKFRQRNKI